MRDYKKDWRDKLQGNEDISLLTHGFIKNIEEHLDNFEAFRLNMKQRNYQLAM